jgi:prepilin-type processing-associated H-X9-DG protein
MPPEGVAFFGCNCKPLTNTNLSNGQYWAVNGPNNCLYPGQAVETFNPPWPRTVPSQMNAYNIYPFNASGSQVLMCDGHVTTVSSSVNILVWSAAITPNGGEAVGAIDQ